MSTPLPVARLAHARPLVVLLLFCALVGSACSTGKESLQPSSSAATTGAPGAPTSAASPPVAPVDTVALERIEELTESFANGLLGLSVETREGDESAIAARFAETLGAARVPNRPGPLVPEWKWISKRAWQAASETPAPSTRAVVAADFVALINHFTDLDDVRFKVTGLTPRVDPDGSAVAEGKFKCFFVGRNGDGRREWARGTGLLSGRRATPEAPWILDSFAFDAFSSLVADVDIFEEVAEPAGVFAKDPSFAERGSAALLAHGSAVTDVDLDGRLDIFVNGFTRSYLYLAQADGTFREAAAEARVIGSASPGVGALFLDFDNDGDSDLFITTLDRQVLFENRLVPDGKLAFRDVSTRAGVDVPAKGFSAAAGDVNGDGLPDIAVACYGDYGRVMPDAWDAAQNGTPNLLFLNLGDGRFREAAAERGVADSRWSYGTMLVDLDGDADLDLLVANDFGPGASLFVNDGKGYFTDETASRGLAEPGYAMGVSVSDVDADGDLDVHVTKMSSTAGARILGRTTPGALPSGAHLEALFSGNSLFLNEGGGHFKDVSHDSGPFKGGWAWGGGFLDIDDDGLEDLYTPNGFISGKLLHDT